MYIENIEALMKQQFTSIIYKEKINNKYKEKHNLGETKKQSNKSMMMLL